jgi:hypothetical protein
MTRSMKNRFAITLLIALLAGLVVCGELAAQERDSAGLERPGDQRVESFEQYVFTLRHQNAADALALVRELLSDRGRVELQSGNNTLVIVDAVSRISTIAHLLNEFDHPARTVRMEILILHASKGIGAPSSPFAVEAAPSLERKLARLLPYDDYRVLARTEIDVQEGRRVSYDLGSDYLVQFEVGTVVQGKRLKLRDFKVLKKLGNTRLGVAPEVGEGTATRKLYNSHVNLWLDRTLAIGFARNEESESGMVVAITCSETSEPRR